MDPEENDDLRISLVFETSQSGKKRMQLDIQNIDVEGIRKYLQNMGSWRNLTDKAKDLIRKGGLAAISYCAMYVLGYIPRDFGFGSVAFHLDVPSSEVRSEIEAVRSGVMRYNIQRVLDTIYEEIGEIFPDKKRATVDTVYCPNVKTWLENLEGLEVMGIQDGKVSLDKEELDKIFSPYAVRNLNVVILSLAGAQRTGKSFLLNLLTRYFLFLSVGNVEAWREGDDALKSVFKYGGGCEPITTGISITNKPLWIPGPNNQKVALFLMDTQGVFHVQDTESTMDQLFALNGLLSSCETFNVQGLVQLSFFQAFQKFVENSRKFSIDRKPRIILFRDWANVNQYGFEHGKKYLEGEIKKTQASHPQLAEDLTQIFDSIRKPYCLLMPEPSRKIRHLMDDTGIKMKDCGEEFLQYTQKLGEELDSIIKTIGPDPKTSSLNGIKETIVGFQRHLTENENMGIAPSIKKTKLDIDLLLLHIFMRDEVRLNFQKEVSKEDYDQKVMEKYLKSVVEETLPKFKQEAGKYTEDKNMINDRYDVLKRELDCEVIWYIGEKKLDNEKDRLLEEYKYRYKAAMDMLLSQTKMSKPMDFHMDFQERLTEFARKKKADFGDDDFSALVCSLQKVLNTEYRDYVEPRSKVADAIFTGEVTDHIKQIAVNLLLGQANKVCQNLRGDPKYIAKVFRVPEVCVGRDYLK